ncbi:rRNA pseudouridine synthase [Pseudomonas fontis]|uniref:rRNA pseudouridine synthase n=1 Tax=Pseudomonas fontis TaxID=2942633 RepID=A0ABT5NPI7_9PSED|nr:rRNA pseudouridine synthase [Pseudomonas fontis]MDD0972465.1 rRNA pseudouridine synthase [Pseudomonas fontis]MDD0990078.1 rRNA pseudouridine synthase [Pseudomonas fontis]
MSEPIRLSKRLIELVGCSRREAELYIEGGWVTVAGEVIDEPQFKVEDQPVVLLPGAKAEPAQAVTLLLHQLADQDSESGRLSMTPQSLSEAHAEGYRALKGHFARLTCVAELQQGASGLQIYTQDWSVQRKITSDLAKLEQEYVVEVSGDIIDHGLERLNRGFTWKGKELPKVKASWQNETRLRLVVKNPAPGLIKLLCTSVGLSMVSMRRIRLGGVAMSKLPAGQWRYLASKEKF